MSHGTNAELALRDLGIEIEKLQAEIERLRKYVRHLRVGHDIIGRECYMCDKYREDTRQ